MVYPEKSEDRPLLNTIPENMVLLDWGPKSYEKIAQKILKTHCVMILGKFSPSIVDDLYDRYGVITNALHNRNTLLKDNYESMDLEDKRPTDDIKSKKYLLTVLLKSKTTYDLFKHQYKQILNKISGANPGVELILNYVGRRGRSSC